MNAILQIEALGYNVNIEGDQIRLRWNGQGNPDPQLVVPLLKEIRAHKIQALQYLKRQDLLNPIFKQGECETCPACGYWEGHGPKPFCFYEAVFLCKSSPAQLAEMRRENCPLRDHKPCRWELRT